MLCHIWAFGACGSFCDLQGSSLVINQNPKLHHNSIVTAHTNVTRSVRHNLFDKAMFRLLKLLDLTTRNMGLMVILQQPNKPPTGRTDSAYRIPSPKNFLVGTRRSTVIPSSSLNIRQLVVLLLVTVLPFARGPNTLTDIVSF